MVVGGIGVINIFFWEFVSVRVYRIIRIKLDIRLSFFYNLFEKFGGILYGICFIECCREIKLVFFRVGVFFKYFVLIFGKFVN